jgi:hypothetical protein
MKCPSCGYENKEDAEYCNLCQRSFVKAESELRGLREPSAPYGLDPLAGPRREGAQRVLRSRATGENWFQRHLNWTWLLAQCAVGLIGYFVVTIFVSSLFVSSTTLPSEASLFASISFMQIIFSVLQMIAIFGVGTWVLKRKNRSLAWLLIFFVPLVGWIIFLRLENRSGLVALPAKPRASIQPGLASRDLESRFKYGP